MSNLDHAALLFSCLRLPALVPRATSAWFPFLVNRVIWHLTTTSSKATTGYLAHRPCGALTGVIIRCTV